MRITSCFLLLFYFLLTLSCGSKSARDIHSISDLFHKSQFETLYPEFDKKELNISFQHFSSDAAPVDSFYKANQYESVWVKDTFELSRIDTLLYYLDNSTEHGLNPDLFEATTIRSIKDSVMNGLFSDSMPALYVALNRLESKATYATFHYATGMKYGFIDQKKNFANSHFISLQQPDSAFYEFVFANMESRLAYLLSELQPKDAVYSLMQEELKYYRSLSDSTFNKIEIKSSPKNYKLNDADSKVMPLIAKRLMLTGELTRTEDADSIYKTLTPELMEAIQTFRRKNSYPEDEEVGKITIDALNRPMSYYVDKIVANLERYRWKRQTPIPAKYVEVNVAAFHLKAIEPGYKPLIMNVCVGTLKNQTPMMECEISIVNLNPTWGVPRSIIENEMYYSIQKDPNYFKRNRMKVSHQGQVVNTDSIDWSQYTDPKRFPFSVRQDSGDGNSLGRVKFLFDNPFSVYLHDTPSKRAFNYKNRAVSHGCVRLQKPMDFAYFCLANKDSLYYDRLRHTVDQPALSQQGKELQKQKKLTKVSDVISLDEKVLLFIDYFTAYALPATEEKKLYFADDVYGFDERINTALKKLKKL